MSKYRALGNVRLLTRLILAFSLLPASLLAQSSTASLDFSSGGVVVKGITSYAMNRCRLEDLGDKNRRLRLFTGNKFTFIVSFSAPPKQVNIKIDHSFAEDASKLAPKIRPPVRRSSDKSVGKQAPVTLYVNGEVARSWEKFIGPFKEEDITIENLKEGENKFELRFADESGTSGYWIKSIKI
jgi:hypothetical protein